MSTYKNYLVVFSKIFIQCEYGIKSKPETSVKPHVGSIIERLHQVLGNSVRTYKL